MNRKVSDFLVVGSWVVLILLAIAMLMAGCSNKRSTKEEERVVLIKSLYAPSSVQKGKTGTEGSPFRPPRPQSDTLHPQLIPRMPMVWPHRFSLLLIWAPLQFRRALKEVNSKRHR